LSTDDDYDDGYFDLSGTHNATDDHDGDDDRYITFSNTGTGQDVNSTDDTFGRQRDDDDNATVVALSWEGSDADGELPTLSSINLPEGAVTTTIAIGQFDDDEVSSSEMSEEDIERQISEIRQAILRSNEDPQGGTA
jgi:hypothetical protein